MRIVIFGGGMQGRVIAKNLVARSERPEIVLADINEISGLDKGITFRKTNVLDKKDVSEAVKGADAAVLAVPSSIAHDALQNLIETGISVCDVSFTPDPPLSLNKLAESTGSCCVVDCGVAPGLSHMLVGYAYAQLGGLDSARILVGGMAQNPPPVFHHAVYFNPADLLSEYVRPARARIDGKEISPAPLEAEIETYNDAETGLLDAFLSDGLRSLLTSYPDVPQMVERTFRVHGHMDTMKTLGELGLLDDDSIQATAKKLGTKYAADNYPDFLLMVVEAKRGNKTLAWRLLDHHKNGESAMSRTTGYTTAAVAMMLATKKFTKPGVHAPEKLGEVDNLAQLVMDDLKERGVITTVVTAAATEAVLV